MNGSAAPPGRGNPPLPSGLRVAGLGSRIGAWLIDSMVLGVFQVAFWLFAGAVGAVSIDPEAQRQLEASPLALPTVAPYQANLSLLALLLAAFVVLNVVYATVCWSRFRGMPGQRLLSLQVGSAATGRNISLGSALLRAVIVVGIPIAAVAGIYYAVLAFETSVPWSDVMNPQAGGPAEAWLSAWSNMLLLAVFMALAWPAILLISTAPSRMRQGLHDRLTGSLVVGKASPPAWVGSAHGPGVGPALGPPGYGSPPADGSPPEYWLPPGTPPPDPSTDRGAVASGRSTPGEPPPMEPGPGTPTPPWSQPEWRNPSSAFGESDARPAARRVALNRRIAAYLLDCFLVLLISALTEAVITVALLPAGGSNFDERTTILLGLVVGLEQLAYFTAGWAILKGTLAQRAMHLRVEDVTSGKALTWMDAVVRWAILQGPFALVTIVPNAASMPVQVVATVWAAFLLSTTRNAPDGRGPHDRFLNCQVTRDA